MLNFSFSQSFDYFISKINNKENFALVRYGDGERMILNNEMISQDTQAYQVDKWKYKNNLVFSKDLKDTCLHREKDYFYAISCTCCDIKSEKYYRNLFNNHNITFANIFVNSNYVKFLSFIQNLKEDVVLIANKNCLSSQYPFNVLEKNIVEDDCINWYENNKNKIIEEMNLLSKKYQNKLFFVSAGPLSEILIHNLYVSNPNNTYIDVGSSLDVYTHKRITRPYQDSNSYYSKKQCFFE